LIGAADLLRQQIRRKIPDAVVRVELTGGSYAVTVVSRQFAGEKTIARQEAVYAALSRVPLTLLAKVVAITCDAPEE